MSTKSEFPISIRTSPTVSVRLAASARAALLRTKPSSAIAASTLSRVRFADEVRIVEHIRYRADRNASTPSDVLNARVALLCHVGRLYLEPRWLKRFNHRGRNLMLFPIDD